MNGLKQLIIKIIDILVKTWLKIKDTFWRIKDFFYRKFTKVPHVASVDDTIDEIVNNKRSIARFGDGEIKLAAGKDISFQDNSKKIRDKARSACVVLSENRSYCPDPEYGSGIRQEETECIQKR